jgi:hypothetical protein
MKKMLTITFLAISLSLTFCTRNVSESPEKDVVLPKSGSAVLDDDDPVEDKKYVEKACTVGNCAGTLCEAAKGKCKKDRPCEALPDGCPKEPGDPDPDPIPDPPIPPARLNSQYIETLATQHATKMVKEGYIDQKDFEASRKLAKDILNKVHSK